LTGGKPFCAGKARAVFCFLCYLASVAETREALKWELMDALGGGK
jgi:hypothetical protein